MFLFPAPSEPRAWISAQTSAEGWSHCAQAGLGSHEVPKGMGVGSRESAGLPESPIKHVLGPQKIMM